jgi:hypothetical protein
MATSAMADAQSVPHLEEVCNGGKVLIQWDLQICVKQIAQMLRMVSTCSCACPS